LATTFSNPGIVFDVGFQSPEDLFAVRKATDAERGLMVQYEDGLADASGQWPESRFWVM